MKKENKSLFALQIEANKEAHELSVLLGMVGINANIEGCELILEAQKAFNKMGDKFDIKTAVKIRHDVDEKYSKIKNEFNNQ